MTDYNKVFLDTTPLIYFLDSDVNFGNKTKTDTQTHTPHLTGHPVLRCGIFCFLFDFLCWCIFQRSLQRDNPMKGENDETAVKAGISPPMVFPLHSFSFTIPHIAGFCFFYSDAEVFGLKAWLLRYGKVFKFENHSFPIAG